MHKGIGALLYFEVGYLSAPAIPESLSAVGHRHVFKGQAVYLAEGFGCIQMAVVEPQTAVVPERCTVGGGEMAVAANDVLALPESIQPLKTAFHRLYMAAFLEPRLALTDGDAGELEVTAGVQGSFAGEYLVCYIIVHEFTKLNGFIFLVRQKLSKMIQKFTCIGSV